MSTVTEYRPSEDEEYMNPAQISYFEKRLRGRKEELQAVTKAMKNALRQSLLKGPDLFDVASSQIDLSIGLEDLERNLRQLMQINKALERIQQGEYGYCDMTGDMIGLKRLEAYPYATLCVEAQERMERENRVVQVPPQLAPSPSAMRMF